ncbi:methionine--tRNA ligase subunit beta [Candidatus Woesearchaeota archaeon]|nr:methionine--tRNA ligase subunit beta [Candidatus Woesearchaeota archaeon]
MNITFEDFEELDIRIGKIISVEKVESSDKLIKLLVDLGTEKRQIVVGMAEFYEPDYFIGKEVPILVNLEPKTFRGIKSEGMILAADVNGKPVLLHPEKEVPAGSIVK